MTPPVVSDTPASHPQPTSTKINWGPVNLEVALPKWAVTGLTTLTLLATTSVGGFSTYVNLKSQIIEQRSKTVTLKQQAEDQAGKVTNLKQQIVEQASASLIPLADERVPGELYKHQADQPADMEVKNETLKAGDGSIRITHYLRDGCIQIVRLRPGKDADAKWIFGTQAPPASAANANPPVTLQSNAGITLVSSPATHEPALTASQAHLQNAVFSPSRPPALETAGLAGRCLNPHPGTYTPRNTKIDKCNVLQTRTYPDGCTNTQRFNSCTGSWEVSPSGAPKISWTNCVH